MVSVAAHLYKPEKGTPRFSIVLKLDEISSPSLNHCNSGMANSFKLIPVTVHCNTLCTLLSFIMLRATEGSPSSIHDARVVYLLHNKGLANLQLKDMLIHC